MDLITHIGRDLPEPTKFDINVSNEYLNVSRQHATISWHGINDGKECIVVIEDHDTSNGTFINGRRYAKTKLHENDVVRLGGNTKGDYQLDLKSLFEAFRKAELKERIDFSEEFEDIKDAYEEYRKKTNNIKKRQNSKNRFITFTLPSICTTLFGIIITKDKFWTVAFLIVGFFISVLLDYILNNKDVEGEISKFRLKYQSRYKCPKCGYEYPFSTHWTLLENRGCINPKGCDAKFKKEERN